MSGTTTSGERVGECPAAPWWLGAADEQLMAAFPNHKLAGTLHRVLVRSLGPLVQQVPDETELDSKPLVLQLELPLPPRLRFYMFCATQHASERQADTFRIQLTTGKKRGRNRFSRADGIRPVLVGYEPELETFILWDANINDASGFTFSKGVQAPPDVVYRAAATGAAEGIRRTRGAKSAETVIAARRDHLVQALLRRIELSNAALTATPAC